MIAVKTLESQEKLALKILFKTPKKWGIYSPNRKLAVRLIWQPDRPGSTGRSTANGHKYDRWGIRSTARSTAQIQRAKLSGPVDRPVGRPTVLPDVHKAVHVGRPSGRPAHGAVDLSLIHI